MRKNKITNNNIFLTNNMIIFIIICLFLFVFFYYFFSNPIESFKNKQNKYLLFTSAGDKTHFFDNWLGENREYDVMVVYYGDEKNKYKKYADYYFERKGSKFQNLYYFYKKYPTIFNQYDAFFIVDDDIIIKTDEINYLFNVLQKNNLWIIQPSYKEGSKISWEITKNNPNKRMIFTNFIEMGVPVMNKYALQKIMKYYDPILTGWGIDYLYMWACGIDKKKYAIIHDVSCINPYEHQKNSKKREIDILEPIDERIKNWMKIKNKYNIPDFEVKTYD